MILGFSLDHLAGVPADLILEFGQLCVSREGDTAVAACQLLDSWVLVSARNGELEVDTFIAVANMFDTTHRPCHDQMLEGLEALLETRPDTGHTVRLTLVRCIDFARLSEPAMVRVVSSLA